MGFTPRDVDRMTLWEMMACQDGYATAHNAGDKQDAPELTDDWLSAEGIEGF
jgi:hypothetical protein